MQTNVEAALLAGALAGVTGLLAFLIVHALWIRPIWFILPIGLIIAGLGGVAVGWAYAEMPARLPGLLLNALAVMVITWLVLAPALVLAELREPVFSLAGERLAPVSKIVTLFVLELLLTSALMGGGVGWLLGHTPRAALAMALAAFIFALGPGHNIPLIGATPGVPKELVLIGVPVSVSSLVLVYAERLLAR